jgi:hypothetical protein
MKQQQILASSTQVHQFLCMIYMLGVGHTSVWCVAVNLTVAVMTG